MALANTDGPIRLSLPLFPRPGLFGVSWIIFGSPKRLGAFCRLTPVPPWE